MIDDRRKAFCQRQDSARLEGSGLFDIPEFRHDWQGTVRGHRLPS
jgi:hypothetical protein